MEEQRKNAVHNIILESRNKITISGVTDVDCFDEGEIRLFTALGELVIQGKNLHIISMTVETGDLSAEGEISAVIYGNPNTKSPTSFFGKLFK